MVALRRGFIKIVATLKLRVRTWKIAKSGYDKMNKTDSMRIEIKSRKAQRLIAQTLKMADTAGDTSYVY